MTFSYCIDSENRNIGKPSANNRRENNSAQHSANDQQQMYSASSYQYTLADVPKLAEQAANMYAQNQTEKESYVQYYTDFYTKQISQVGFSFNPHVFVDLITFSRRDSAHRCLLTRNMKLIQALQLHNRQLSESTR